MSDEKPRATLCDLFGRLLKLEMWTRVTRKEAARAYEKRTGQELAMVALECALWCVALAPDGATILAGDGAGSVYCLRYVEGGKVTK